MPMLSWNEIRQNAILFSRQWEGVSDERAEAQTFWNEFFQVFGVRRRTVASFEEPVRSLKNTYNRIDLFWRGRLLAEHKSAGESFDRAESQAFQYVQDLMTSGREDEAPRYVVLSNFHHIALYDLEPEGQQLDLPLWRGARYERVEFRLQDFHRNIRHFAFIIGQKTHRFGEDDPANLEAAELMAQLHDTVKTGVYETAALERLLVRLLFCLFADDTGIFETAQFELFIENKTKPDGSDLGAQLHQLFEVLNTLQAQRSALLDEDLAAFPYVNGDLFAERLPLAGFNRDMRNRLLAACRFDWSRISPAIFGSLFQGIMDAKERRQIGGYYTSERNILKVICPLFLDALREEFFRIREDHSTRRIARLHEFQEKLSRLKFLDPACGCGNFLVIAYRELRRLELEALKLLYDNFKLQQEAFSGDELAKLSQIDVDRFYGIEIGEWPARIAETALWLTDHQMNTELSLATGNPFQRIPLRASPHIRCANALRFDWNELLPAQECSYVLGNPPFVGKKARNAGQQADMALVFRGEKGTGVLDYVTCWYVKAGEYIIGRHTPCAFVSTNSITQGEQPGVLWPILWRKFQFKIHFAHRTFAWESEARGAAHVHVVIIGFSNYDVPRKLIFDYEKKKKQGDEPFRIEVSNINPYLVEGRDLALLNRTHPIAAVPPMNFGNMPNENGRLILDSDEKRQLLKAAPNAAQFIRPLISAKEYFHGVQRWCIWLKDVAPGAYRGIPEIMDRVAAVKEYRRKSDRAATKRLSSLPYLFGEIRQPQSRYVLLPRHSSERRTYIPFTYFQPRYIAHDSCLTLPNATLYHFGVLTSAMHIAWVCQVCGRLESRYRYSAKLVYNNFPWPPNATKAQRRKVEECAQKALKARQKYLDGISTLADLYDPLTMPDDLLKAHQALDQAVDRCYRRERFHSERERVEFLFKLYEELTSPLAPSPPARQGRARRRTKPGGKPKGALGVIRGMSPSTGERGSTACQTFFF